MSFNSSEAMRIRPTTMTKAVVGWSSMKGNMR
jgi:hypothetical protein